MAARDAPRPTGTGDHLRQSVVGQGEPLLDQLARFAREHGCENVVRLMCAEVPSIREVVSAEGRRRAEARADLLAAGSSGRPWTEAELVRLRADMRRGRPVWRTALDLNRTCMAVRAKQFELRRGSRGK